MSRYQAARRRHFLRGLTAAILMFTVFIGALSLADRITAESIYVPTAALRRGCDRPTCRRKRHSPSLSISAFGRMELPCLPKPKW